MVLEGTVTNVAAFGSFVNIGVHQDGLVHISAMSKTFIKDPRKVVKPDRQMARGTSLGCARFLRSSALEKSERCSVATKSFLSEH